MLKDLIFKSKRLLAKENDNLPLGMRGELEVIVRDKDNNIVSYQKDHNTITNFMKHEIIHLLAGDIFNDSAPYEDEDVTLYNSINPLNHTSTLNNDGMLFSQRPYFFDLQDANQKYKFTTYIESDNTGITSNYIYPRYPVKMLFGTGSEYDASQYSALTAEYGSNTAVNNILGYATEADFTTNINLKANYYSNKFDNDSNIVKCRTVQPKDTLALTTPVINSSSTFGITGAIKNSLIYDRDDEASNYNSAQGMANPEFRGIGRPSFIYAERSLTSVREDDITSMPGYIKIGKSADTETIENKLTFSVIMPRTNGFYPYNGFILKEAGLFSDSLFKVGGTEVIGHSKKMPCGTLLAKRYISPVLKTEDNSIEFIWSIYISTTA